MFHLICAIRLESVSATIQRATRVKPDELAGHQNRCVELACCFCNKLTSGFQTPGLSKQAFTPDCVGQRIPSDHWNPCFSKIPIVSQEWLKQFVFFLLWLRDENRLTHHTGSRPLHYDSLCSDCTFCRYWCRFHPDTWIDLRCMWSLGTRNGKFRLFHCVALKLKLYLRRMAFCGINEK